ncbi:MAG: hypothetical protein AAGE92_04230, partial [Cyanobacteria bacterium P01_G01_bin.4]
MDIEGESVHVESLAYSKTGITTASVPQSERRSPITHQSHSLTRLTANPAHTVGDMTDSSCVERGVESG